MEPNPDQLAGMLRDSTPNGGAPQEATVQIPVWDVTPFQFQYMNEPGVQHLVFIPMHRDGSGVPVGVAMRYSFRDPAKAAALGKKLIAPNISLPDGPLA